MSPLYSPLLSQLCFSFPFSASFLVEHLIRDSVYVFMFGLSSIYMYAHLSQECMMKGKVGRKSAALLIKSMK